ncbi:MAG: hypothetical protein Q8M76_16860, partial [Spirochaetaceae bacterium]|nr:hypothetical protein [Spirochaetaceae bacterium]
MPSYQENRVEFSGRGLIALIILCLAPAILAAQAPVELDVAKVVLFSSGVAYVEHRGQVEGNAVVSLPFETEGMNDALKSLIVSDPDGSSSPSVSYPSQESLDRALKGFRVDLSGSPGLAAILSRLRGAEVEVDTPAVVIGKIVSVEERADKDGEARRPYLVLMTSSGLRSVSIEGMSALRFVDARIAEDFQRALGLILAAQDNTKKILELRLPGARARQASFGYVVAAPVWKVSYRLDLSGPKPSIQGWAIVDNQSDRDWKDVSLSFVSGRPVSFVQELYPPYWLDRPYIPLAIAGTASARSFDSGFGSMMSSAEPESEPEFKAMAKAYAPEPAPAPAPASVMADAYARGSGNASGGALPLGKAEMAAASATSAGDQFEFTVKKSVTLERRKSAMIPLVAGPLSAEKVSIYSLDQASGRPLLGARLVNDTGMRLPAGPITVFDGGVYAGDALLDFLPEKDKRLIAFGEDLSLLASSGFKSSRETIGVSVTKGIMIFSRQVTDERSYSFKNRGTTPKTVVIEHPFNAASELWEPKNYDEKTSSVYRFSLTLAPGAEAAFPVKERRIARDSLSLTNMSLDTFVSYSTSGEIRQEIKDAFKKAIELRRKSDDAKKLLADLQSRKTEIANDQLRIRQNLEAVGRDGSQGQQYLKRLMDSETEL